MIKISYIEYTELDRKAYSCYFNNKCNKFDNMAISYCSLDYFIDHKSEYVEYYNKANIELRLEKLKKINLLSI